VILCKNFR